MAREILPHERWVRAMLLRSRLEPDEIDEVIQDCYCRFAMLDSVAHIELPKAYFRTTARNLMGRRMRRAKVVPMDAYADMDLFVDDATAGTEQYVSGKSDFELMRRLMDRLPDRCRHIVEMRKLRGLSQKEIAVELGLTEKAVEKQIWLGVKALREEWSRLENDFAGRLGGQGLTRQVKA